MKIGIIFYHLLRKTWFMIILFFLLLFIILRLLSYLDIRYLDKGNTPHVGFSIVIFDKKNNSFTFDELSKESKIKLDKNTFLANEPMGQLIDAEGTSWSYKVLRNDKTNQLIEVEQKDDDRTLWSTYSTDGLKISPVKSQLFSFDSIFAAIFYAFLSIICLRILSKIIVILFKKENYENQ